MAIRYYFSWFDEGLPNSLQQSLSQDLADRTSLVMINGQPSNFAYPELTIVKDKWLEPAGIVFDNYQMIDYRLSKKNAQSLLAEASAIFVCGGITTSLHTFLLDYGLTDIIKQSSAVVMGASAGAINMSAKWLCSKNTGSDVTNSSLFTGMGLDDFFFCSKANLSIDDTALLAELLPLSRELNVYVAVKECAIRLMDGNMTTMGDVYLIADAKIHLLAESIST